MIACWVQSMRMGTEEDFAVYLERNSDSAQESKDMVSLKEVEVHEEPEHVEVKSQ